jgi:hypothetical protein
MSAAIKGWHSKYHLRQWVDRSYPAYTGRSIFPFSTVLFRLPTRKRVGREQSRRNATLASRSSLKHPPTSEGVKEKGLEPRSARSTQRTASKPAHSVLAFFVFFVVRCLFHSFFSGWY